MPAHSVRAAQAANNTGHFRNRIPINRAGRGAQTTMPAHGALVLSSLAGASAHLFFSLRHTS